MTSPAQKMATSLLLLAALFAVGTVGFAASGQRTLFESLYVTAVILTTVGMKEGGPPLTEPEMAWSVLLMVVGIGTALYATGNVVAFMIDGQLRSMFGRRQLMRKINNLSGHFIVVGFGRMGQALCTALHYRDVPFVLIDCADDRLQLIDELGYLYVRGDAMHEETLVAAGIDRAQGLASCLPDDADNVFVTLTARGLNEKLKIVSRAEDVKTEAKLSRAGADRVICPPLIGAGMVTQLLMNPLVDEILELDGHWPDLEVTKLSVHRFPRTAGRTIGDLLTENDEGVMVVAVVGGDGTRRYDPPADTLLEPGDEVVLIGPTGSVQRVLHSFGRAAA